MTISHIGTYCDDDTPPDMRHSERFDIIFKSTTGNIKFRMAYSLDDCGGFITESQTIRVPTHDSATILMGMNCIWKIRAPEDHHITIQVDFTSMELSYLCSTTYLSVYRDWDINPTNLIRKLCGFSSNVPMITIPNSSGMIHFHSADHMSHDIQSLGFRARIVFYKFYGETFYLNRTAPVATVHSISSEYDDFLCKYTILSPEDTVIQIKFNKFHIQNCNTNITSTNDCLCNYIEIHDGLSVVGNLIGRYCGHNLPPLITSSQNSIVIIFVLDASESNTGFEVEFRLVESQCGQRLYNISETSIILQIPLSSASKYEPNINCEWLLITNEADLIEIEFENFNLQDADENGLCIDYLEIMTESDNRRSFKEEKNETIIFSGNSEVYNRFTFHPMKVKYCGSKKPKNYLSFNNKIIMKFLSNSDNITRDGLKLKISKHYGMLKI